MNKKIIWGVVIVMVVIIGMTYVLSVRKYDCCDGSQQKATMDVITKDWKTYTNEKYEFSVAFPPAWNGYKVEEKANGVSFGFDKNGKFSQLLYIGKMTKAEWIEEQKSEVHAQFLVEKDGTVFTYSHANGDPEAVNKEIHASDFGKIISTFKFTSPTFSTRTTFTTLEIPTSGKIYTLKYPVSWVYFKYSCNVDGIAFWPKATAPSVPTGNVCPMSLVDSAPIVIITEGKPELMVKDKNYQDTAKMFTITN